MSCWTKKCEFPFSPKQIAYYNESDSKINIAAGAVRSGKSYIILHRFIKEIYHGPKGKFLFTGKSEKTIRDNIIDPINELLQGAMRYHSGHGYCTLGDRIINVIGANDERAVGKIQGNTYAGALVDEMATLPQSYVDMLMTRLSISDSKLFGGTNPDSPYHWLKADYIDKLSPFPEKLKVFNFQLEDNPILDQEYIDFLKKRFSGLWYKRFIEGKWVQAEGAVYDFFDSTRHVVREPPTYAKYYILGVDYGTTNPFAAVLIGFNDSYTGPKVWVEKEYYWDSKVMGYQKTDAEYAHILKEKFGPYSVQTVYLDPSAKSFETELKRNKWPVRQAKNDVLDGIRCVANFLSQGTMVICESCPNLLKEFESYVWDDRSVRLGQDKPLKQRDHALDALRYALFTKWGNRFSIEELSREQKLHQAEQRKWNANPMQYPGFTNSHGWESI